MSANLTKDDWKTILARVLFKNGWKRPVTILLLLLSAVMIWLSGWVSYIELVAAIGLGTTIWMGFSAWRERGALIGERAAADEERRQIAAGVEADDELAADFAALDYSDPEAIQRRKTALERLGEIINTLVLRLEAIQSRVKKDAALKTEEARLAAERDKLRSEIESLGIADKRGVEQLTKAIEQIAAGNFEAVAAITAPTAPADPTARIPLEDDEEQDEQERMRDST